MKGLFGEDSATAVTPPPGGEVLRQPLVGSEEPHEADLCHVMGQEHAKRALEVGSVCKRNILFVGPSGGGKSMLCGAYAELLGSDSVVVTAASSFEELRQGASAACEGALVVAKHLNEFSRPALFFIKEVAGRATIAATCYPCPCGNFGDPRKACLCSAEEILQYRKALPTGLVEMFDIQLEVPPVPVKELIFGLLEGFRGERSSAFQGRMLAARAFASGLSKKPALVEDARHLLATACEKLGYSARAIIKVIALAGDIAALEGSSDIHGHHVSEAIQYQNSARFLGV